MNDKQKNILQLYIKTLDEVISSPNSYKNFLSFCSNFYSYSVVDCLFIYSQRKNATQCATYDYWVNKSNLRVAKGSKGIALLKSKGIINGSLEFDTNYVFDVKDVIAFKNNRIPQSWKPKNNYVSNEISNKIFDIVNMSSKLDSKYADIVYDTAEYEINKKLHIKSDDNITFDNISNYSKEELVNILKFSHSITRNFIRDIRQQEEFNYDNRTRTEENNRQYADSGRNPETNTRNNLNQTGREIRSDVVQLHQRQLSPTPSKLVDNRPIRILSTKQTETSGGISQGNLQSNSEPTNEQRGEITSSERNNVQGSSVHSPTNNRRRTKILIVEDGKQPYNIEVVFPFERTDLKHSFPHDCKEPLFDYIATEQSDSIEGLSEHMTGNLVFEDISNQVTLIREENPTNNTVHNVFGKEIKGTMGFVYKDPYKNCYQQMYDTLEFSYKMRFANIPELMDKEEYIKQQIINREVKSSVVEESSARIYTYFNVVKDTKKRISFLKKEYGWGGHGCAFELGGDYNIMCSPSKGMDIEYSDYEHNIEFNLSFKQMEATISEQIALGIYPIPSDTSFERYKARYEAASAKDKVTEEVGGQINLFEIKPTVTPLEPTIIDETKTPTQTKPQAEPTLTSKVKRLSSEEFFESYHTKPQFKPQVQKKDFTVSELSYPKGKKAKYKANIESINLLKKIESENRFATAEEQVILSKYTGWGGLAEAFDSTKWADEYTELKSLLDETEYKNALSSVNNAHYTPDIVIKSMYKGIENMGFNGGNILEPSMGTGNFFSLQSEKIKFNSKLYGVELDSISGRISKQLHQNAEIHIKGFEETNFSNNFCDLSIGNIPFGDYKIFDKSYKQQKFLVHDYFIAKMIDSTRPGGLVAVITSKGTMDKENQKVRKYIAQRAELVGAIRLPNNTFMSSAETEVTSDILFFQKRDNLCDTVPSWVETTEISPGIKVNKYFEENPQMLLGDMTLVSGRFGQTAELLPNNTPLKSQLEKAILNLPKNIYAENVNTENNKEEQVSIPADYSVKDFTFTVIDDDIYYRENSKMYLKKFGETQSNRIKGLCTIRDNVKNIINMQIDGCTDEELEKAQQELNNVYDNFVKQYGYIDNKGNRNVFKEDVDYPLLLSLENVDDNKNVVKSAIFSERTVATRKVITKVETAIDGLAVSLCDKGYVDIKHIEKLSGLSFDKIIDELKTSIFKNPLSNLEDKYDGWETADEYLSGNVVEKLSVATELSKIHTEFEINAEALKRVQPEPLSAGEISVQLGSPWVDKKYYEQFIFELLQTPLGKQIDMPLDYNNYNNTYTIRNKYKDRDNVFSFQTYGTSRISAYQIIEDCLNQKMSEVRDAIFDDDNKTKYVVNQQETYKARSKQDIIKDKFSKWIFEDKERRDYLVDKYNRCFNCIVPREYDGSIFSFDGMNPKIKLRKHQENAVARMVLTGKALLAHEVGAGKTFTYIAGIMEMERIGLANKAIITVPNHLTEQQGHDILQLYPGANILVATSDDFSKGKRQRLISQIATGNFDIIVIGHSQFEKLTMPPEVIERNINEELETLGIALNEAENNDTPRYTIKQMETTKKRLEEKLQSLLDDSEKDNVITFDQLGVDYVVVDEAHMFKNCPVYTKMRNVAGVGTASSQRASDMMMKVHYMLEQNNGRGVTFATGTPISNSMSEMYIMQKYLQPEELRKRDLYFFDNWAAQYGETSVVSELSPEGDSFRERTRFAKFVNLPELMNIFTMVADIKTSEVLNLDVPQANRHTVVCPSSFEQKIAMKKNIPRAKRIRNGEVTPYEDNMLKLINDARKIGLDAREFDSTATDFKFSKVNKAVENILNVYTDTSDIRGTQVVFCDMSTPKQGFNVYCDIRDKLIEKGIPEEEIAFIHDYKTDRAKDTLFDNVNSGKVRVIFGSTQKCGAGTNMQKRLVALHHMDCPYRPADLQQREGRIVRQGNINKEVDIFTYVTENSFDSYLWSIVEKKQRFISQIMTNKQIQRVCEDIDETVLNYAEVMALSTGNPLIKEKMELEIDVRKLKMLATDYQNNKYRLQDSIETSYPQAIRNYEKEIALIYEDIANINTLPRTDIFAIEILGATYDKRTDSGNLILSIAKTLKDKETKDIGSYKGLTLRVCDNGPFSEKTIELVGSYIYKKDIGDDGVGLIKRIENMYSSIPDLLEAKKNRLSEYKLQLEQLKIEYEKPFEKEQEYKEKSARLDEINKDIGKVDTKKETTINVVFFKNGTAYTSEISSDFEKFENELSCKDLSITLLDDGVVAISRKDDKFGKSSPTCIVENKNFYGDFFICGIDENANFCELSHNQLSEYKSKVQQGKINEQGNDNNLSLGY